VAGVLSPAAECVALKAPGSRRMPVTRGC